MRATVMVWLVPMVMMPDDAPDGVPHKKLASLYGKGRSRAFPYASWKGISRARPSPLAKSSWVS